MVTPLVLILIPHQRQPELRIFDSCDDIVSAAMDYAHETGRDEPEDNARDAACTLADDCHCHILLEHVDDMARVVNYTGHRQHEVRAMLGECAGVMLERGEACHCFDAVRSAWWDDGGAMMHGEDDDHQRVWWYDSAERISDQTDIGAKEATRRALAAGGRTEDEILEDMVDFWIDDPDAD